MKRLVRLCAGLATASVVVGLAVVPGSSQAQPMQPTPERSSRAAAGWGRPVFSEHFSTLSADRWANVGRPATPIGSCGAIRKNGAAGNGTVLRVYPQPFAACRLTTVQPFGAGADLGKTYKFSARLRLPTSRGHYASFWTNGDPYNEIDVVESYGRLKKPQGKGCAPGKNQTTNTTVFRGIQSNYYRNASHAGRRHCWTKAQVQRFRPFDGGFHVYSVVWNPGKSLTFRVDGATTATFGKKYARRGTMALILTDIDNDDKSANKEGMEVDWVKAWRKG